MSAGFWKKNERVIMVVFLVLLAPLFMLSPAMLAGSPGTDTDEIVFFFDDQPVELQTYRLARKDFVDLRQYLIAGQVGALVQVDPTTGKRTRKPLPYGASDEEVRFFLSQELEAKRMGIEPSKEQIQDALIELAKPLLAHYRLHQDFPELVSGTQPYFEQLDKVREQGFSKSLYVKMLGDETFLGDFSSVRRFEEVVKRRQRITSLIRTQKPVVTEKDIWNEYKERNALRVFDFVEIKRADFEDQARADVGADEERAAFENNSERFRIQDGVQLEVVKMIPDQIPVSDEEVLQRYETDKDRFYVKVGGAEGDETEFRPLDEVRDRVEGDVRADKQSEILADVLAEARTKLDAGEEFTLMGLVPADLESAVTSPEIPALRRGERLPTEILAPQLTQAIFSNYTQLEVGQVASAPLQIASGDFIYRVTEKLPSRPATFEEVADEAGKLARDERANELLSEYVDGLLERIDEDPELDLEGIVRLEGLEVHRTDPLRQIDRLNVTINDTRVAGSVQIVNQGFLMQAPGDLERVDALDRSAAYLVRYVESQDPTAEDFEGQRENLERQLQSEKQRAALEQFRDGLEARITYPQAPDPAVDVE